jgi:hypothetical protein
MKALLFPDVLRRLSYTLRWLGWGALISLASAARQWALDKEGAVLSVQVPTIILFLAGFAYLGLFVVRPRLKDIRANPWFAWLLIVPLANLLMLLALVFVPGDRSSSTQSA